VTPERAAEIQRQVHRGAPTFTGKFVDPMNLTVEDIDVRDIAHHLSQANRYMGACDRPYSVAQHSVLCARIVWRDQKRAALFHDASEAYYGDLSRVIKYHRGGFLGMIYRQQEAEATKVIERALGFDPGDFAHPDVKWADDLIGDIEWKCLIERTDDTIVPWTPEYAEREFLDAAARYC
jgi:hypothetical protein